LVRGTLPVGIELRPPEDVCVIEMRPSDDDCVIAEASPLVKLTLEEGRPVDVEIPLVTVNVLDEEMRFVVNEGPWVTVKICCCRSVLNLPAL
jgi:hypothetical protein